MFQDIPGVMAVIILVPVFFLWLERRTRWRIFDFLPAIIWVFLAPIFLSHFRIIPRSSEIYDTFKSFAVPLFILLMLLDINIRESLKAAWRGIGVLIFGSVGIVLGAVTAFYLFQSSLGPDAWSGFGALAGSWIGGTGNLAAVAESLQTPSEMVGIVVLVDNFVYVFYFPVVLMCRRWNRSFVRFSKGRAEYENQAGGPDLERKRHEVRFEHVLTLLGFGFLAIVLADWIASTVPELPPVFTQKTWSMLLVTTIGILLSSTRLKDTPGTQPISMALVYIYMTMIGASADLGNIGGAQWFLAAGFLCIFIHFVLIVAAARIFRVDISMAAVASVAAVGGAASAPVAAGYHREELVPISIMLALVGYALGNYLGVATAYLCYAIS